MLKEEVDSLAPGREFSRRGFVQTTVGSGFAACRPFSRTVALQIKAIDEFHDEVGLALLLAGGVQPDGVGVLQAGHRAGLVDRERALPTFIAGFAGSVVGAWLLLRMSPDAVRPAPAPAPPPVTYFGIAEMSSARLFNH